MTGIICLTLKYTVNILLMNSEGSVRIVCMCIFMGLQTSEENNCQNQRGLTFYGSKIHECMDMNNGIRNNKKDSFGG